MTIAKLVNQLHSFGDGDQRTPVRKKKKSIGQNNGGNDPSTHDESTVTDLSSNDPRTLGEELGYNSDTNGRSNDPRTLGEELGYNSDINGRSQSLSERRASKKTMKDKKNQEKAFKNQQKFDSSVTQAQIDRVARVIHGARYNVDGKGGHPRTEANNDGDIFNRDDAFNPSIKEHMSWLHRQVKVSRARNGKRGADALRRQQDEDAQNGLQVQKQDIEELVSGILVQLGIHSHKGPHERPTHTDSPAPRSKKQNVSVVLQLRKEIAADIEKSENEGRARQQRMEGYWRYVNDTVTDRLANNAQSVDRATGMRLKGDAVCGTSVQRLGKLDHREGMDGQDERPEETV